MTLQAIMTERQRVLDETRALPTADVEALLWKATARIYERTVCQGGKAGRWSHLELVALAVLRERGQTEEQIEAARRRHKMVERRKRKYGLA